MIATCNFGSTPEPEVLYQLLFRPERRRRRKKKKKKKKKQDTQINCVDTDMRELLQPF
jgi:hypothetical protein